MISSIERLTCRRTRSDGTPLRQSLLSRKQPQLLKWTTKCQWGKGLLAIPQLGREVDLAVASQRLGSPRPQPKTCSIRESRMPDPMFGGKYESHLKTSLFSLESAHGPVSRASPMIQRNHSGVLVPPAHLFAYDVLKDLPSARS